MASGTATITAPLGPGLTVTSLVINDVTRVDVDLKTEVITVHSIFPASLKPKIEYFEFSTIATITWTVSGEESTIAFST